MTEHRSRAEARFDNIEERLTRIEVNLGHVREDCEETNDLVRQALHGDGKAERGLAVRVDRLEQWKRSASKVVWVLVGAVSSLVSGLILWLVRGPSQ